jgi:hypothetical protein
MSTCSVCLKIKLNHKSGLLWASCVLYQVRCIRRVSSTSAGSQKPATLACHSEESAADSTSTCSSDKCMVIEKASKSRTHFQRSELHMSNTLRTCYETCPADDGGRSRLLTRVYTCSSAQIMTNSAMHHNPGFVFLGSTQKHT